MNFYRHVKYPKVKGRRGRQRDTDQQGSSNSSSKTGASLVAQLVKNPPAALETWVRSLGWEDPLEKGKATHSSILA